MSITLYNNKANEHDVSIATGTFNTRTLQQLENEKHHIGQTTGWFNPERQRPRTKIEALSDSTKDNRFTRVNFLIQNDLRVARTMQEKKIKFDLIMDSSLSTTSFKLQEVETK